MQQAEVGAHPPDVAANLATVRTHIADAARAAGRDPGAVALVAVSKGQPADRIEAALAAGHRIFGENRLQEAEDHWLARRAGWPDLELHFIGPLQTNKVRHAVRLVDVIQTVDRPKLATRLAEELAKSGRHLRCFVEINTGEEPQKAGVTPGAADAFVRRCREEWALPICGLMCIPPFGDEPAPHFALLREIARRNDLPELSMGMSADYPLAVQFGATLVRVGTAIFGERQARRQPRAP